MRKIVLVISCFLTSVCFAKINVNKSSAIIHVESGAHFVESSQLTNYSGRMIKDSGGAISGGSISFDNGTYEEDNNKVKLKGDLDFISGNNVTLNGNKSFSGERGKAIGKLKISGSNNRLEGILQLAEEIVLLDCNSSVTCAVQGRVSCNIVLNGGSLFLEEDLHFVDDTFFTGSGVVWLNQRNLHLGSKEATCGASLYFDEAQDIEMHANLHLAQTWTFSGHSLLEGNGRILYLEDNGEIVLEQGSSLLLRDVALRKISGNKVKCLDSHATLSFQNVIWIQDGNYSFTTGAIEIIEDLYLMGNSTFAYQSAQPSTICSHGKILVDRGMTFSFDPIWNASVSDWGTAKDFLVFEDSTSILELKGATLHVTTTSMKLKKGTLRVKDKSYVSSELDGLFHMEEGLIIGNNSADEDMRCEIGVGSVLEISRGAFSYKNINSSSWDMSNNGSKLSIASGGKLKLHQTLDSGEGIVAFQEGSRLARASGKSLQGAVHMFGDVYYECCYN